MDAALDRLADDLVVLLFDVRPFAATVFGVPGHDHRVPDLSAAAALTHLQALEGLRERAAAVELTELGGADRVTLAAVTNGIRGLTWEIEVAAVEHTVSPGFADGPAVLLDIAGWTRVTTPEQAQDLLTRTGGFAGYLEAHVQRLHLGEAAGAFPVSALVASAVAQVDDYLSGDGPDAFADVEPPAGWDGAAVWSQQLRDVVREQVRPALERWRAAVVALPTRDDAHCGLVHLPGGAADYDRLVALHTTLPLSARAVHETGRRVVAELVAQAEGLGAELGLAGFAAVRDAVRESGEGIDPRDVRARSQEAVARAEAACAGVFPAPMPAPCAVEPMPHALAAAGTPAHYSQPAPERGMQGTYWFNALTPGVGAGWDLEVISFHEAVPGHHLQFGRLALRADLPAVQRYLDVTAHFEGWGLYAEVLADELGLYSSTQSRLGANALSLVRAARLVVDTGIHALGWSREQAVAYFLEHAALAEHVVRSEIDRYIGHPGQALAYTTGQREIMRLRASARERLGEQFDLAGFHGAVLDHGQLPLEAVGTAVDAWVQQVADT